MTLPALQSNQAELENRDAPLTVPHNLELEQALLGCVLFDSACVERIEHVCRPEHFYEISHGVIFAEILALAAAGRTAQPIALVDRLHNKIVLPHNAPRDFLLRYLADMVDHAPPTAHVADYAIAVRGLFLRRELHRVASEVAARALRDSDAAAEVMIEDAEVALLSVVENDSKEGRKLVDFRTSLDSTLEMIAEAYRTEGGAGLDTGLVDLNRRLGGGLYNSDLVILAGRPSMGKSALATKIAFNIARAYAVVDTLDGGTTRTRGGRVAFFSLEMNREQLTMRMLSDMTGISTERQRKGDIDALEFGRLRDAAAELSDLPLFIDDTGAASLARIAARARRMKRRGGLQLIVIDYLQLIGAGTDRRKGDNRVQELTAITSGLKALAKELEVPVIALSQLSRQVEGREDKRPQLSDLRESGSIEQDADVVAFVFREHYYLARSEPSNSGSAEYTEWMCQCDAVRHKADVIIAKQRMGPIGVVKLSFNEDTASFGNLAYEAQHQHWMERHG